jgi:hypothetical protein
MVSDSEPNEAPRKTLDDIRRELEAEYGYVEIANSPADVREVVDEPRPRRAFVEPQTSVVWNDRDDLDDTIDDVDDRTDASDFRAIADRHERSRGREQGQRRSGYLIAAIVGCVAGQALLLAYFTLTRPGGVPDVASTAAALRPRNEAPAPAPTPAPAASDDAQPAAATPPQTDVSAASSPSAATVASPAVPSESKADSSEAAPQRLTPEPRAPSSPPPAVVSTATVPDRSTSRQPIDLPPRVAREQRVPSARSPGVASAQDWAAAQARLRSALNQWLKASAVRGTSVSATEPVIVLNADGRTAKTYVSMASPVGLIPREQRWELGPGGWNLIEDRQAGLPQGTTTNSRER